MLSFLIDLPRSTLFSIKFYQVPFEASNSLYLSRHRAHQNRYTARFPASCNRFAPPVVYHYMHYIGGMERFLEASKRVKGMKSRRRSLIGAAIIVLIACIHVNALGKDSATGKAKPQDKLSKATSDLVSAINQYKASVEVLIPMYEAALKSANEMLEKRKELYEKGIVSKRDVEASELAVKEAQARLDQSRKQIVESDQLMAEAKAEQEMPRLKPASPRGSYTASSAILRYGGAGGWSISRATQVQSFFASRFGRALPVSALGQTATHNRMGFDHRNSLDVAVHPDSAEGQALIAYLRSNGIPFIAFRSAVPGAATGAHIHIGYPSHRI